MALPILDGNQTAATLSTIITGGAHIPAHTVVSLGSQAISDITSGVSGSVVSISNFPSTQTIAGTVTANLSTTDYNEIENIRIGTDSIDSKLTSVSVGFLPAISGTVTANNQHLSSLGDSDQNPVLRTFCFGYDYESELPTAVAIGSNSSLRVQIDSGTVTANNPSGALTTRFGSVVTANLAFITSAVTNTSRKYLLAQNISAGTVTIGIGFSPTTTQGIQLTAGGGLTFDAFCPTGAVYWLGAVTGAAFTILEG